MLLSSLLLQQAPILAPVDGVNAFEITVTDGTLPVQGARVLLVGTGLSAVTGTLGKAVFYVDEGTYQARVASSARFVTGDDVEIEVTGDTSASIALIPVPLSPPPEIEGVVPVVFDARDFGAPVARLKLTYSIKYFGTGPLRIGGTFETDRSKIVETGEDGRATAYIYPSASLPQGASYHFEVPQCGIKTPITVPGGGGNVLNMIQS
jgi:hypothetical protein